MGFVRGRGEYPWPRLRTEVAWEEMRDKTWRLRGGIQREAPPTPLPTPRWDS